ncbi:hypothetical protein J8N05_01675 [Streptomyces sp. BH-SS-21]|uniref:Lipoprotein n=1 Tax=Streptomyces liliiviolaceus TaxID=2823109 RepID=A0A940XMQ5_9ACTN|nr:hypothetical protein [Streptomyces liliiviolaceus]
MRVSKAVFPVLALMAVAVAVAMAGCSSSESKDEQRLTAQRENYCTQLGAWQKARDAARTDASGDDGTDTVARDALLALEPLRDETVGQGRTLAEATAAAMNNADSDAEGRLVQYCDAAGFETLMR